MATESGGWSTDAEAGDVDGDGDDDLVISDLFDNDEIIWLENPRPTGDPRSDAWLPHTIGSPWAHDLELADEQGWTCRALT